jgi:DNA-binding NtrC family response regulator
VLRAYSWPGNIRELRNVIERAVILCSQAAISPGDLPSQLLAAVEASGAPRVALDLAARGAVSAARPMRDEIRSLERERIVSALSECGGNQTRTAKLLGISRRTLTTRLSEFALPRPRKARDEQG